MGERWQNFVDSLKVAEDEAEMVRRVDEGLADARGLGKRRRVKHLASLKTFLQTGQLPLPGKGRGRPAVLGLADALVRRGMRSPDQFREPVVMPGEDAAGRKRFALVLKGLRERFGDDLTDTGALLNAVDVQLRNARQEGRHKLAVKLLALRGFLAGGKLKKSLAGRAHIKALAVDLAGRGRLALDRLPLDR